ncbi:MAG: MFS transporter [bacterium]
MENASSLPKRFSAFIATQALGALNDNLFKMLLQLFVLQEFVSQSSEEVIATASLIFTVPFVLFGPGSGYVADRFSKSRLMRLIKFAEILIMGVGVLAISVGKLPFLYAVLFLMATHSTFFSPAKSGFIPEICKTESITAANSWLEMTTFIAIIVGTAMAGPLVTLHGKVLGASFYCMGVAALGWAFSFFIPPTPPAGGHERFPVNPLTGIFRDLVFLKRQKGLFLAALANSYFWLLGLIFTTNILVYGKKFLGLTEHDNTWLTVLPAFLGLGIGSGSMLAGRWSGKKVELGLVPLGGIGLSLGGILLFFTKSSYLFTSTTLFLSGVFGGLFIIPLYAFLQFEAKEDEKGRVLATTGILNGLFLVLGSLFYRVLAVEMKLTAPTLYLIMGLVTLGVVIYICTVIPEYLIRFLWWLLTHTFYDIKIVGAENVPFYGPALLVPNHVSFIDAQLVGATVQRFIKFIMYKTYFEVPVLKQICKIMEVIPIAPYEGRDSVMESLKIAGQRLKEGEVVCIFAEGKITRDGNINEFRPGFEAIMEGVDCPIIPVYLHNVWGSIFSFEHKKVLWKWPKRIPYRITVVYGAPLPSTAKAPEVETAVRQLADAFAKKEPQALNTAPSGERE